MRPKNTEIKGRVIFLYPKGTNSVMYSKINPIILSGGSGSRIWPLSRKDYPKHLIPLLGERSLLQETVLRLAGLDGAAPLLVCNQSHRFLIAQEMNEINTQPQSIILEPCARNTAPAIAIAALSLKADDLMLVLPADHLVQDEAAFTAAVKAAVPLAQAGHLVTFGVTATSPHTGYGYIQQGDAVGPGFKVSSFVEKPDLETAQRYLDQGGYYWNAGMFLFKASSYLDALAQFEPEMLQACQKAYEHAQSDLDFIRLDETAFEKAPDISVDYAVMERTDKAVVVPMDAQWSDVGSWDSLYDVSDKDADGNVILGDVLLEGVTNSYIRSSHHLIAAIGLDRHLIVDTPDAVLVAPMSQSQAVKKVVEQLKAQNRHEPLHHQTQYRPWGSHELLIDQGHYQVRRVKIKPGYAISMQRHQKRTEHWVVVQGVASIVCDGQQSELPMNESFYVPRGVAHRVENKTDQSLIFIEVQVGQCLKDDEDTERLVN